MDFQTITIRFAELGSYRNLIACFQTVYANEKLDRVILTLDFSGSVFVHSDHLLAIVATVSYLREKGIVVEVGVEGESDYASRVNFFRLLDVPYEENFVRRGNVGRFIELSKFTNDTTYDIQDRLTMILHQMPIDLELKQLMFYCLGEIMDNVLVHSSLQYGWACAQFYPGRREIRLMICDNGIGVLDALRNGNEKSIKI